MGGAGSGTRVRRHEPGPDRRGRTRRQPDHRGAARGVGPRLEGVRARGHARRQRQHRRRLLDREPRPDGRAHRRLDHRRAGDDADRPRVPGDARHGDRRDPRRRRRDRRLQHPVRDRPGRRPDDRHRDEPAGLAVQRAGVEGDRLPDRQDRGQGRHRLLPRRDPQRHHAEDTGQLRADARLRRGQGAAVRVREVPGRRPHPHDAHEERRRGDGDRAQLHRGAAEGAAVARAQGRRAQLARRSRRQGRAARAAAVPHEDRLQRVLAAIRAGATRRRGDDATGIDPWFADQLVLLDEVAREVRDADDAHARAAAARRSGTGSPTRQLAELTGSTEERRPRRPARARGPTGLQDRRHLRRRVRRDDAVPLLDLRRGDRGPAARPAGRASSSAPARTGSARASSSTTPACTPRWPCPTRASRP